MDLSVEDDDAPLESPRETTRSQEGRPGDRRLSGDSTASPAMQGLPSLPTRAPAYTALTKEPRQS